MKGIKRIRLALKRVFCAKERKTVDLEQEVYRIIKNRDVCKMIGLIQNGLDVNMPIRKSSVYFDWISSQMVLRPKDVVLNYPNEAMLLLLRGMNAKTQNEMLEFEEMQRKEEEKRRRAEEMRRAEEEIKQGLLEEENKLRLVKEFLEKAKD